MHEHFRETPDSIGTWEKIILYQERFVQSQAPFVETFTGIEPYQKKNILKSDDICVFFRRFQWKINVRKVFLRFRVCFTSVRVWHFSAKMRTVQ